MFGGILPPVLVMRRRLGRGVGRSSSSRTIWFHSGGTPAIPVTASAMRTISAGMVRGWWTMVPPVSSMVVSWFSPASKL